MKRLAFVLINFKLRSVLASFESIYRDLDMKGFRYEGIWSASGKEAVKVGETSYTKGAVEGFKHQM